MQRGRERTALRIIQRKNVVAADADKAHGGNRGGGKRLTIAIGGDNDLAGAGAGLDRKNIVTGCSSNNKRSVGPEDRRRWSNLNRECFRCAYDQLAHTHANIVLAHDAGSPIRSEHQRIVEYPGAIRRSKNESAAIPEGRVKRT